MTSAIGRGARQHLVADAEERAKLDFTQSKV